MSARPDPSPESGGRPAPGNRSVLAAVSAGTGRPPPILIWAALGVVYVVWGSTYFGIRIAIDSFPPLMMAGIRYLVAGAILYLWALRRGTREERATDRPTARQWASAAVIGGLLLLCGNGSVSWAELRIPTGLAALLVATVPLWMALLDRVLFGVRLRPVAVAGLLLGFAGLAVLFGGPGPGRVDPLGAGVVLFAAFAWAIGSLYSRGAPLPRRPLVGTGMELLTGGGLLLVAAAATGEFGRFDPSTISTGSIVAVVYLIVFGSILAFTAYVWLLRVASTSLVSTYAYVNPVVALFLGWAFLAEPITGRTLISGLVIIAAVVLIVSGGRLARRGRVAEEPPG